MSAQHRVRIQRILREAEGYLELAMPRKTLEALDRVDDAGTFKGHKLFLVGKAYRDLERYDLAIEPLVSAADLMPSNLEVWLAVGWCYKRIGRVDLAIQALERARDEVEDEQAIIYYNLACYWSLAQDKDKAIENLSRAIAMEPHCRELVHTETDFDPIRSDPEFQSLAGGIVA